MTEPVAQEGITRLYLCMDGPLVETDGRFFSIRDAGWDDLFNDPALGKRLTEYTRNARETTPPRPEDLLAPIGRQEVWAAGVTYWRSRTARMAESEETADAYDRVYTAARPELFFKATPHRVAGPGQPCGSDGIPAGAYRSRNWPWPSMQRGRRSDTPSATT